MTKCTKCGNGLPADALFCPQCAQPVAVPVAVPMPGAAVATISDVQTISIAGIAKPMATLADGEVFHGRYTIERQLGAGAMGVVYAARDQVTSRTVALKLINAALADRPTARERFLREGLMARDIRHANVVAMYDVGEANGQVYLVMEYLGGETLRRWLRRTLQAGRDVSFDTARAIIRRVLEGLAAAHATGVVHRDLKPENVMLAGDPNEGEYSLKILDFGIARAVGATSHLTTTSSSTGTPLYMAPEQKTAADTVGPAADLYAVTAMFYELLLGVAPEGRWSAPSRERTDLPSAVDTVIETGLASRPRSRYQSADEYINALDRIAAVPPLPPVRPPEPPVAPPQPPEPMPPGKAENKFDWLKARSPAWALWDRMSTTQRWVFGILAVIAVLALIGYYSQESEGPPPVFPPTGQEQGSQAPSTVAATAAPTGSQAVSPVASKTAKPSQPPPVADMKIAGRWSDAITGTIVNLGYVDFVQQGNAVTGIIYNTSGYQVGTLTGRVQGTTLEYDYLANNGMTGSVSGELSADTMHLELDIVNHQTGHRERHTLHRNHLPHQ